MQPLATDSARIINAAALLRDLRHERPEDTALVAKSIRHSSGERYQTLNFLELDSLSDSIAHGLAARGVGKGTRVLLLIPPGIEFVATWFSLLKIGATAILIDPGMGGRNLRTCIAEVEPEVLISVPVVHAIRKLFRASFRSLRLSISLGGHPLFASLMPGVIPFSSILLKDVREFPIADVEPDDTAGIAFTTGSTGVPKGVVCTYEMFLTQIELLQQTFSISSKDVAFPAFLPFALFCIAMGSKTIMPNINPRRPADAEPTEMLALLNDHQVTYSFGSPAFWAPLAARANAQHLHVPSLTRVIMFGAPIPAHLHQEVQQMIAADGQTHTPYGATEALPVCSIEGREIINETAADTALGCGVCVGRPLGNTLLRIIPISDLPLSTLDSVSFLPHNEIGEILVAGPQVSAAYVNRPQQTQAAKIRDGDRLWHRMGDVGYLDTRGRLWFCGRKNHRVQTASGTLFSVPCESIFNQHPAVFRSALVGLGEPGSQTPVLCVELKKGLLLNRVGLLAELRARAQSHELTHSITHFLVHPDFPVDFRHNAKIIREELQIWADAQLPGGQ
jgi:acyl-CoA synthetase (AMP-forming)/AMP-acid ligase II